MVRSHPLARNDLPPPHPLAAMAFPRWLAKSLLIVATVALWLPTLAVVATFATVAATGCQVNEATTQPCVVAGRDIGAALYGGLLLVFLTGPTLLLAIGAVIVCVILKRRAARSRVVAR